MGIKIYPLIVAIALSVGLASCHDVNWRQDVSNGKTGEVNLKSIGLEVSDAEKVVNSSRASVDVSGYLVKITGSDGSSVQQWTYSDMPEVFTLPVGKYSVAVESHRQAKAEWDAPYYAGSKAFEITDGNITPVGVINCRFSNIRVSIFYDEQLRKNMGADTRVVVECNDEGQLVYLPDETRSGYFEAIEGSSTLVVTFTSTIGGKLVELRKTFTDIEAGQHHKLTFKAKDGNGTIPDELGFIEILEGLYLDATIISEDITADIPMEEDIIEGETRPGTEDGGEEPDPGPDPGEDGDIELKSENLSFTSPMNVADLDGKEYVVNIRAKAGVAHLVVKIGTDNAEFSGVLAEMGIPMEFDLAYPGENEEIFRDSLGFPTGIDVLGKGKDEPIVFDITQFVPLLGIYHPSVNTFSLSVTDANGKLETKALTFIAN